jgi:hypothetical protein
MTTITDHWVDHYLKQMTAVYFIITDQKEFTAQQKDAIYKTLKFMADNFKKTTHENRRANKR